MLSDFKKMLGLRICVKKPQKLEVSLSKTLKNRKNTYCYNGIYLVGLGNKYLNK